MSTTEADTFFKSPLYQEAMSNLQAGEWEQGLSQLNELQERFPLEPDLRLLFQEMQLRSGIDLQEEEDQKQERSHRLIFISTRVVLALVLFGVLFFGVRTYMAWIQSQSTAAYNELRVQVDALDIQVKLRNAENLNNVGRYAEAKAQLDEIRAVNPNMEGLSELTAKVETNLQLDTQYNQAIDLVNDGKFGEALPILKEIAQKDPNFKDVQVRLNYIERGSLLEELFTKGELDFNSQRWEDAISSYETIRSIDATYRTTDVEEHLYLSYINAADTALQDESQTLEALQVANDYFRKALALRPQDQELMQKRAAASEAFQKRYANSLMKAAEDALTQQADSLIALQTAEGFFNQALTLRPNDQTILTKREMARNYLDAIGAFSRGQWDIVVNNLEFIYQQDPGYAAGTALQTLYEAHMSRGKDLKASGEYPSALDDFKRAAVLAQDAPDSTMRLYEARLMIAETQGLLGEYEDAVILYRTAVDQGNLLLLAQQQKSELVNQIAFADLLANSKDYITAYKVYRDTLKDSVKLYNLTTVKVAEGDYLTMLARRYNSTVQAILQANGLTNRSQIELGQELKIPTLP